MTKQKDQKKCEDICWYLCAWTFLLICVCVKIYILSLFFHYPSSSVKYEATKVDPVDVGKTTVSPRVSRSIQGLPPSPPPPLTSEGTDLDKNILQRNSLSNVDPVYLQDKHKSGAKRRVKKVLKSSEYLKFLNGKEEMMESKDEG
ncbi:unnamed protein product [Orchesella dallaii]|uniref:Uncharacterized protein n=1 Tax=Orchesella dallaii TaxID=48710 RepID=A0ABP1RLY0_9HEXA